MKGCLGNFGIHFAKIINMSYQCSIIKISYQNLVAYVTATGSDKTRRPQKQKFWFFKKGRPRQTWNKVVRFVAETWIKEENLNGRKDNIVEVLFSELIGKLIGNSELIGNFYYVNKNDLFA